MPARLSSMDLPEDNTLMVNGDALAEDNHASFVRRSGRVVKKREVFAPATVENVPGGSKGKRKRTEQNQGLEEDPADESGEETTADEAEEEADAEEAKEKRRKAKTSKKTRGRPAAKKPKTTTPRTSTLPLRTVARKPQAKPRTARRKEGSPGNTAQGLYGTFYS